MAWPQIKWNDIRELSHVLLDMCNNGAFVWRGEPEIFEKGIRPRIDRREGYLRGHTFIERIGDEIASYERWWNNILPLLQPSDVRLSPLRRDGVPELAWLNYATHHGCRTRLVDWSLSPWPALYFACSKALDKRARLWAFDVVELQRVIGARWDEWRVPKLPAPFEGRDIAKAAFAPDAARWISPQFNLAPPQRMRAQQGLFTIASRLGERHEALLDDLLPDTAKLVIEIGEGDKIGLLGLLRSFGIHHESLQYPLIDDLSVQLDSTVGT